MRNSSYRVVKATESDKNEIMAMQRICFCSGEEEYKFEEAWWVMAVSPENDPAGFSGLSQSVYWTDVGYLCRVGVLEPHQGKGLMSQLVRPCLREAKKRGWNYVVTDTTDWNVASANGLISCGFKLFLPEEPWAGRKGTLYWTRDLSR